MATLITLLDVETEVESAIKGFLATAPYSLAAVTSDTAAEVTTPRIEVVAEVTKWGPHQYTPAAGVFAGVEIYDQFMVRSNLSLIYQPEQAQSPGTLRGTLRKALTNFTGIKAAFATHGYLFIAGPTLRQVDGGRTIQNEDKTETLNTTLEMAVFLNPAAVDAAT